MHYLNWLLITLSVLTILACGDNTSSGTPTRPADAAPPDALPPAELCVRDQAAPAGITVDTGTPRYELIQDFPSTHLSNTRTIRVFLPASYGTDTGKSYPVIYMHDGQNLFDAATAGFGKEWEVDENIDRLVKQGSIPEVIVVGIDNTPDRINEYTVVEDPDYEPTGGKGRLYGRFVVEEVKPYIDSVYRTVCDRDQTVLAGSSLGGLISFEMAFLYPTVFGKIGSMSPSFWWDDNEIIARMQNLSAADVPAVKMWIDAGTAEDNDEDADGLPGRVDDVRSVRDRLIELGASFGTRLGGLEVPGAAHEEPAWAERFDDMLLFLIGNEEQPALAELALTTYGGRVALEGPDKDKQLHVIVTATYEDGRHLTVPGALAELTVADETIATVDSAGVVRPVALGTTTLTASYGGKTSPPVAIEVLQTFPQDVDITFDIMAPADTPADKTVTMAGTMNGWQPRVDSFALEQVKPGHWRATYTFPRNTNLTFKFTLQPQTGDLFYNVEKDASCGEIPDRTLLTDMTQTYAVTIARWRNVGKCGN